MNGKKEERYKPKKVKHTPRKCGEKSEDEKGGKSERRNRDKGESRQSDFVGG